MTVADLDDLHRWLAEPHVAEWWDEADEIFDAVLHPGDPQIPGPPVSPWVFDVDGRPAGFIQWYRVERDEYFPLDIPVETVGIDLSIGELDLVGIGIGRRVLPAFIAEVVLPAVPACTEIWIDPDLTNQRARRAYAAAGFVDTGTDLPDPDHPEGGRRLMRQPAPSARLRSVAVYCASSPGFDPIYADAARALGTEIGRRGLNLVYGGGHVGLMGVVADAALAAGGTVTGVITRYLWDREVGHDNLTELLVVDSMHDRKLAMSDRADGFIALPGGLGTMEELFEVVTWTQLGLHQKPVALLDVARFFQPLLAFLDGGVTAGFIRPEHRALVMVDDHPAGVLEQLARWVPRPSAKWRGADQR